MPYGERAELERRVQDLDRKHPDWRASEIERELESLVPVAYANWRDRTPSRGSRLRQVQRWRGGIPGPRRRAPPPQFQHLWPVGERQRQELDPAFSARPTRVRASHRIFLYNCSPEILREVRTRLEGQEVGYEPALPPGRLAEIFWFRSPVVLAAIRSAASNTTMSHPLVVDYALSKGTRRARLEGALLLHSDDGWTGFRSKQGMEKEVE
jgi:hypothetical protein